jgi:hypothetical protein
MFEQKEKLLIVNHVIYLTPEQRKTLVEERQQVAAIGISIPVWFDDNKGSAPAREVFCQYTVTNEPKTLMVAVTPSGYRINLTQPKPDDEETPDYKRLGNKEGMGWLKFKQLQVVEAPNGKKSKVLHYVEIRDWEYFWDSVNWRGSTEVTCPSACSPSPQTEPLPDSSASRC